MNKTAFHFLTMTAIIVFLLGCTTQGGLEYTDRTYTTAQHSAMMPSPSNSRGDKSTESDYYGSAETDHDDGWAEDSEYGVWRRSILSTIMRRIFLIEPAKLPRDLSRGGALYLNSAENGLSKYLVSFTIGTRMEVNLILKT